MTEGANKRSVASAAIFVLLVVFASAAWAGNVLILGSETSTEPAHLKEATTNVRSLLQAAGHTVDVLSEVPSSTALATYDQVWDLRYTIALDSDTRGKYEDYLTIANGKRMVLVGENDFLLPAARNNSLRAVISSVGGGTLTSSNAHIATSTNSTQVVQSPFTAPNALGDVTYALPGGVTGPGNGQFITIHTSSGVGSAVAFGPGALSQGQASSLVVVFDVNVLENKTAPGAYDPEGDDQKLLMNIIAYLGTVQPVATTVVSGLNFPFGVAINSTGVVHIADHNNHKVWRIGQSSLELVAGASPAEALDDRYNGDGIDATLALLDGPSGVAVDAQGNVFIADSGNHIVRKVSIGGLITTVVGTPTDNSLDLEGAVLEVGNGGPATSAVLNGPRAVAVDSVGNLYIVDTIHQQVRKVDSTGTITVVAGVAGETGSNDGAGSCPAPAGTCVAARLNDPRGVAVDAAGNVYIADAGNDKIRKVTGNVVTTVAAGPLDAPTGVAVASDGTLYIADHNNNRIQRVSGTTVTTVPLSGLSGPYGLALDPATGDLYIADKQNHRILKVDFTPPPILLF